MAPRNRAGIPETGFLASQNTDGSPGVGVLHPKPELGAAGLGFGSPRREPGVPGWGFGTPKQIREPRGWGLASEKAQPQLPARDETQESSVPRPHSRGAHGGLPHLNHGHAEVGIDEGGGTAGLHRAQLEKEQNYEPWPSSSPCDTAALHGETEARDLPWSPPQRFPHYDMAQPLKYSADVGIEHPTTV